MGHSYPSPATSCCLGFCTGALAAAAVSCSSNALELLPLAIEAVRLAFRIGILVDNMAGCIEPWGGDAQGGERKPNDAAGGSLRTQTQRTTVTGERLPWSFLVKGSDTDAVLCKFNEESNVSNIFEAL